MHADLYRALPDCSNRVFMVNKAVCHVQMQSTIHIVHLHQRMSREERANPKYLTLLTVVLKFWICPHWSLITCKQTRQETNKGTLFAPHQILNNSAIAAQSFSIVLYMYNLHIRHLTCARIIRGRVYANLARRRSETVRCFGCCCCCNTPSYHIRR